jgi:16S rRNA C1402 N4-methylase RsmH
LERILVHGFCCLIFSENIIEQQENKFAIVHGKFTSSEENPQKRKKKMFDDLYADKGLSFFVL